MFTYRKKVRHDTALSRFIDGEMLHHERDATMRRMESDETVIEEYRRLRRLSEVLSRPVDGSIVSAAAERVHQRLEWDLRREGSVKHLSFPTRWWRESVTLPIPIVSAAALLLIVMAVGLIVLPIVPRQEERSIADLADSRLPLNVQVQVGSTESDLLMRWLNEQNEVGHVTIELPDYGEFRLHGEPVLIRPGFNEPSSGQEKFELVPLEARQE